MAKLHTTFFKAPKQVSQIDQDIDRYITEHPDGIYDEVLKTDDRWAVFYHLSDMRAGLLNWYDPPKDSDVLEIDCGFGALTGILCDRAAHVAALDGSMFRARACAKRWDSKKNLDVYAGRLHDIPFPQRFDVIVLADVLPRVADGADTLTPYADYLKGLLDYLKPQGSLLLAMDNRLGLKFVCGARDPYSDEPFGELSRIVEGGRLFTKAELTTILSMAGFTHWKFYYPMPDFRLPQFIFTDNALPDASALEALLPYDPTPDTRVLPEATLYADVMKNGLFPAMANSFLIECGMQNGFCPTDAASLAFGYAPVYNIATCHEGDRFIKKPSVAAAKQGIRYLAENLDALAQRGLDVIPYEMQDDRLVMPRIETPTLAIWLQDSTPKDRDAVLAAMDRLWAAILQSSPPVPDSENCMKSVDPWADWGVILQKAYLNMTPDNIFWENGKLTFFNQGLCRENCPAKYQMFLAVCDNVDALSNIGVLDEIKERYGLATLWSAMEAAQRENIASFCRYDVYHRFYDWAEMSQLRMLKNRQILKIIGNEDDDE